MKTSKELPPQYIDVLAWNKIRKCWCIAYYSNGVWIQDATNNIVQVSDWEHLPAEPKE